VSGAVGGPEQAFWPTVDPRRRPQSGSARPVTTTDVWKFLGVVFVLVDHYGFFFDNDQDWWRVFGRLAAPIFFFFVGFARTRRVPGRWLVLGVLLTVAEAWTEDFEKFDLNILLNFALVRLALPVVEQRIMPFPGRTALLALGIILLIRPVQPVMEYGAEGWLWALFGLSHRLALESATPRALWTRNALAGLVAPVYMIAEIIDYEFRLTTGAALVLCVAALAAALVRFRRSDLRQQPPELVAALLRFTGRYSLEIYAITLFAFIIVAG
jgi:hypothetical protein